MFTLKFKEMSAVFGKKQKKATACKNGAPRRKKQRLPPTPEELERKRQTLALESKLWTTLNEIPALPPRPHFFCPFRANLSESLVHAVETGNVELVDAVMKDSNMRSMLTFQEHTPIEWNHLVPWHTCTG
jgi:hypothetical protein